MIWLSLICRNLFQISGKPDLPRYFLLGGYLRTQAFQLAVPNLRKVVEIPDDALLQTAMEDLAQAYGLGRQIMP
jgi:hypothetical protein